MNPIAREFRLRVTLETVISVAALAVPAAWLAGPSAAIGVLAAGVLAVANFWWLSRAVSEADPAVARARAGSWMLVTGARFTILFAAFAALCAGGHAHPVAVVVGLSVLPCVLIARGLRSARETER